MALFLSCPFYDPWTFVWLCHASCGTSVPSQQWNPGPLHGNMDLNQWATRVVP